MVVITETVSCRSLDFGNQRKAYMLRHVRKWSSTMSGTGKRNGRKRKNE